MTELLFLKDNYLRECEAEVVSVHDEGIVLSQTVFYPTGGGQPHDEGVIICGEAEFRVLDVKKRDGIVYHVVGEQGLSAGDVVVCVIDWERRHKLMRYHTAAHIVSAILEKEKDTKISGNQLSLEKARIDFTLDDFDKEYLKSAVQKANDIISKNLEVKKYFLPRVEAEKIPTLFSLLKALPESIKNIRVVEVIGFDKTACGGCHVNNTKEIGTLEFVKAENKGAHRRRLVFRIV